MGMVCFISKNLCPSLDPYYMYVVHNNVRVEKEECPAGYIEKQKRDEDVTTLVPLDVQ